MSRFRRVKRVSGFNMLELMVVVVILGLLSAIAVPIYARYVRNSRVSEALSRVGELFTAAKTYAIANEADGDLNSAAWPASCNQAGYLGDCRESIYFQFELQGVNSGALKITATGKANTPVHQIQVTLVATSPAENVTPTVFGL